MSQAPINGNIASSKPKSIGLPLLTWDDPVKTGKVFGTLIFALVILKSVNLLSLFFRLGSLALFTSATAEYAGKLITGTGFITRFKPAYSNTFSSQTSKFLESLASDLPNFESEGQKLLYSFNIENTLKAGGLFYILYKITSWISLYTLILTSSVLAFTLPAVYEKYQVEINAAVVKYAKVAKEKSSDLAKVAGEKAAPYVKKADEKLGPVSKFIKQKYQIRTASSTVAEQSPSAFTTKSEVPSSGVAPSSATTSGSKVSSELNNPVKKTNPFETASSVASAVAKDAEYSNTASTNAFPSVPSTRPLTEQAKQSVNQVDVDDLKSDILKNKAAVAENF